MEPLVTIAIPDNAGTSARAKTLTALARHTPQPHKVVLFVEGQPSYRIAPQVTHQQAWHLSAPVAAGIPAALNRLLEATKTPYILLLESGAIVTEGWLQRLLAPLEDETVGLSGPSTNICWNEQQVLPHGVGTYWSTAQIDTYANEVAAHYANQQQALDTLHSLNDFCYLFKRGVAEQLSGFDEAYGAGPCWEIDFNTRAARAGFSAVWVADAYVHRSYRPFPPGWGTLFTANKHLYQDRFCGLRLCGEKTIYEEHCRGEECEHFAPAALLQVKLAKPVPIPTMQEQPPPPAHFSASTGDLPLVSCIMPTHNRRAFVRQSLLYFERQDYPNKELIIIDDGDDQVADLIASHPLVRYMALLQKKSIGEKRNIACELARGPIIAHWDDDDWYAPHRLSYQVAPLLTGQADMTAMETSCFFDLPRWQAWTCTPELHRQLFVGDVHGGTLVYWRKLWGKQARYPPSSLAEDATFLQLARRCGARLQKLPHAQSFVYVRHGSNAWSLTAGAYLQSNGWQRADPQAFLPPDDLAFYAPLSPAAPTSVPIVHQTSETSDLPFVSCIMPTYNRRPFIQQAIAYFLRQDYPQKELVIVDDGTDAVHDLLPLDPRIRYIRLSEKTSIGAKRNIACEQVQGSIIAHWDDDDWHAPHRLRYQVEAFQREQVDICGISTLLFYDISSGRAWRYVYPEGQRTWVSGSTLCYTRAYWASNRFEHINQGEDARFVWKNNHVRVNMLPDVTFHLGIIHRQNASPKRTTGILWHPYPIEEIRQLLGNDLDFYNTLEK